MPKMRTFTFTDAGETKTVEAISYKKAVKSYQGNAKSKLVHVEWTGKRGDAQEKEQKLPMGRYKKINRW